MPKNHLTEILTADFGDYDEFTDDEMVSLERELNAAVNKKFSTMNKGARQALVDRTLVANPAWVVEGRFADTNPELDEIREEIGDGTFVGSYRAVSHWLDILWFLLAVSTAFSVAQKWGNK